MKKCFALLLVIATLPVCAWSQTLVSTKIYSVSVGDSIPVKIWLPPGYTETEAYPVIYEFVYDHSAYVAATAASIWDIPKVIVVWAEIRSGNESYKSAELTNEGQRYYSFVKNELLSYISLRYRTTSTRIATGLSQGADYVNYILRNDPDLFNSYLLFSLEYPVHYTPSFASYIAKLKDTVSYFIGVANDTEPRKHFAGQLYDLLKRSPYIELKKEYYPNADHPYGILYALPDALLFAFRDYLKAIP